MAYHKKLNCFVEVNKEDGANSENKSKEKFEFTAYNNDEEDKLRENIEKQTEDMLKAKNNEKVNLLKEETKTKQKEQQQDKDNREIVEKEDKDKAEKEAKEIAEKEAKEKLEKEKAEKDAKEKVEKEKIEKEAKEKAEKEVKDQLLNDIKLNVNPTINENSEIKSSQPMKEESKTENKTLKFIDSLPEIIQTKTSNQNPISLLKEIAEADSKPASISKSNKLTILKF